MGILNVLMGEAVVRVTVAGVGCRRFGCPGLKLPFTHTPEGVALRLRVVSGVAVMNLLGFPPVTMVKWASLLFAWSVAQKPVPAVSRLTLCQFGAAPPL